MVQLNFNMTLACTMLSCFPLILSCNLLMCRFTHDQNDTPMHENNMSKFSKYEPHHKHKEPQDITKHEPCLKVMYNMYTFPLIDNLMDNYNMATLSM